MFCPKCGSNQGERRFCTTCGTNLAAVSQALHVPAGHIPGQLPTGSQYLTPVLMPYEMERQQEYAKGMKLLVLGGAFLGYNILKVILSFGHASFGFWGVVSLIVFAVGLSKVLSWRPATGVAAHGALNMATPPVPEPPPVATPTPHSAQLQRPHPLPPPVPQPVFSAARTGEIETAANPEPAQPRQRYAQRRPQCD
jgi:hypothetical protein